MSEGLGSSQLLNVTRYLVNVAYSTPGSRHIRTSGLPVSTPAKSLDDTCRRPSTHTHHCFFRDDETTAQAWLTMHATAVAGAMTTRATRDHLVKGAPPRMLIAIGTVSEIALP